MSDTVLTERRYDASSITVLEGLAAVQKNPGMYGTTTRGKIGALREAGATQVHLRVASPPIRHPCYFGIDFPDQKELIAHTRSIEDIRKFLGVDSLAYLSHEGMLSCVKMPKEKYCTACFSGDYPMDVDEPVEKFAMERVQLRMFE